jgi:hypothetical protein
MLQKELAMPQPRKYANRAEQQAAYRQRQLIAQHALLESKGLPRLPAVPTIPGHTRWNAMIRTAYTLLTNAAEEMQDYYDDRSEEWQEGEKAEALIEKMEQIQEAAENVSLLM